MASTTEQTRTPLEEAAYQQMNRSVGTGTVVRIVGPVVDVKFDGQVPGIYTALTVKASDDAEETILEVESQLPHGVVRTVAMSSTDGLRRGLTVKDTGRPMIPRRRPVLPHTPPRARVRRAHHPDRDLRDRHQGHRPSRALRPRRQDRPLRRRRRRQDGPHPGAHQQPRPGARRHLRVHRRRRAHP